MTKTKAPKASKAKSAYIFFCQDNREMVKAELGEGARQPDIVKRLAVLWGECGDEDKVKYQDMADADKERVASEPKPVTEPKAPKAPKTPKTPKAKSAYIFFCQDNREAVKAELGDGARQPDIVKRLAVLWGECGDEDKVKYQDMADADKERVASEPKPVTEPKAPKTPKTPKAPKAKSAYIFFCQDNREVVKSELGDGARQPDIVKRLAVLWGECIGECRVKYQDMADADKIRIKSLS